MTKSTIQDTDAYIAQCMPEYQVYLNEVRAFIKECVPDIKEKISWGLPTFERFGYVVQFAQCKGYIGFYPGPDALLAFKDELKDYKQTKASIHLSIKQPIPFDLLKRIVIFVVTENEAAHARK